MNLNDEYPLPWYVLKEWHGDYLDALIIDDMGVRIFTIENVGDHMLAVLYEIIKVINNPVNRSVKP